MFGLYRRCCSSKDNISVNCRDNGSNLNTFTNSSNISTIPSSILYNRTYRSATGKIMNVLFLLFLVFGSCVVSFGMEDENINDENKGNSSNHQSNIHPNNNNTDIINTNIEKCNKQLSSGEDLLLYFANGLITGIGGYNNTWKPLK